jgi:hypothetical protein
MGRGGSFILRPVGIGRPWAALALGPPLFVVVHRGLLLIKGINKHKKVARKMHPRLLHNARRHAAQMRSQVQNPC